MKVCPFIEGNQARKRGMNLRDNPYSFEDDDSRNGAYCTWIRGFNCVTF